MKRKFWDSIIYQKIKTVKTVATTICEVVKSFGNKSISSPSCFSSTILTLYEATSSILKSNSKLWVSPCCKSFICIYFLRSIHFNYAL